ncbi:hypothetical protein CWI42_012390 [Ordospora colligata]|uniref:Zinc-ribbon 15 domain-containing protein n=1 Tax=Ordospora colligata OC4 TaxID=1354746 RepID=A0A0B2UMH6_9MICR|nr:uncharacterized protein M896_012390 [Ordospora colligata OC4]KHN70583.1 hypothetical protein M896_012390 [Ordospora colligata OC4]TBU17333.1 hypothetical protein CWI41_012390 [Ordospora colligata]TBU17583.1 hypothetical protein CWI40_012390 [Ordospora colligata]TBU19763.1 hypothetical protein CWI42_012390 [Ordospora colligata]
MCCGNLCFLIVGCRTKSKKIDKPEGYPAAPKRIICSHCGNMADSEYRRYSYRCHLCFIPCLPCGRSDPYLACVACGRDLGNIGDHRCTNCDVATTYETNNCPNCGASKRGGAAGGGYRRLDTR